MRVSKSPIYYVWGPAPWALPTQLTPVETSPPLSAEINAQACMHTCHKRTSGVAPHSGAQGP